MDRNGSRVAGSPRGVIRRSALKSDQHVNWRVALPRQRAHGSRQPGCVTGDSYARTRAHAPARQRPRPAERPLSAVASARIASARRLLGAISASPATVSLYRQQCQWHVVSVSKLISAPPTTKRSAPRTPTTYLIVYVPTAHSRLRRMYIAADRLASAALQRDGYVGVRLLLPGGLAIDTQPAVPRRALCRRVALLVDRQPSLSEILLLVGRRALLPRRLAVGAWGGGVLALLLGLLRSRPVRLLRLLHALVRLGARAPHRAR